jgi:hypothetical protein
MLISRIERNDAALQQALSYLDDFVETRIRMRRA